MATLFLESILEFGTASCCCLGAARRNFSLVDIRFQCGFIDSCPSQDSWRKVNQPISMLLRAWQLVCVGLEGTHFGLVFLRKTKGQTPISGLSYLETMQCFFFGGEHSDISGLMTWDQMFAFMTHTHTHTHTCTHARTHAGTQAYTHASCAIGAIGVSLESAFGGGIAIRHHFDSACSNRANCNADSNY